MERIVKPSGVVETKRYIGSTSIVTTNTANPTPVELTVFTDHIGSTYALINRDTGVLTQSMSFDAFGLRRQTDWTVLTGTALVTFNNDNSTRGFTGHEQLDEVGLIHMNGRVYDPMLGGFVSADPFVPSTTSTQAYNRYSYVYNNPLSYTDPSGYTPEWIAIITAIFEVLFAVFDTYNAFVPPNQKQLEAFTLPGSAQGAFGNGSNAAAGLNEGDRCFEGTALCNPQASRESDRGSAGIDAITGGTDTAQTSSKFANGANSMSFMSAYFGIPDNSIVPDLTVEEQVALLENAILVVDVVDAARTVISVGATVSSGGLLAPVAWMTTIAAKMGKAKFKTWAKKILKLRGGATKSTVGGLRAAGQKDAHHIIQDAAAKNLPGYKTNSAPGVQLAGPANKIGTPHYKATQVQRQRGTGTYASEIRIGYKALRRAGLSRAEARAQISHADEYFQGLGVTGSTRMRPVGNRR